MCKKFDKIERNKGGSFNSKINQSSLLGTDHLFSAQRGASKRGCGKGAHNELEAYNAQLARKHTRLKVVAQSTLKDGSILVKIKKQYGSNNCGNYPI